jgi:hypothetical protein
MKMGHIVDVPPYAHDKVYVTMTHVDMFCHYVTPLDFVLKGNPLLFAFTLVLCDGDFIYGIRVLFM